MEERTKRGEEDRKRELDQMIGKPVQSTPNDTNEGAPNTATTRDKGVEPTDDERRSGHGEARPVKPR